MAWYPMASQLERPLTPKQGRRRSSALVRLDAALAQERAGIDDTFNQRAADLLVDGGDAEAAAEAAAPDADIAPAG